MPEIRSAMRDPEISGRRPSRWVEQLEKMVSQGRRNSAARFLTRLRSGSISGWAAGGQMFPGKKTTFAGGIEGGEGNDEDYRKKRRKSDVDPEVARQQGNASMGSVVSALYAKLLVVMGCGFPLAEVISSYIPQSYYDGFYLYLYFVSILFMSWIFAHVLQQKATREIHKGVTTLKTKLHPLKTSPDLVKRDPDPESAIIKVEDIQAQLASLSEDDSDSESAAEGHDMLSPLPKTNTTQGNNTSFQQQGFHSPTTRAHRNHGHGQSLQFGPSDLGYGHSPSKTQGALVPCLKKDPKSKNPLSESESYDEKIDPITGGHRAHFGSFYLRIGAVAFGIGSMIYSGLEFGQYFELDPEGKCHNYMAAITPTVRMIFTFMQMYFIFLNSRMAVSKVSLIKQFGLMHLIGTNLCVWLNVLIQETKHEINHFYDPENGTITLKHGIKHDYVRPLENLFAQAGTGTYPKMEGEDGFGLNSTEEGPGVVVTQVLQRVRRGLKGPHSMYDCGRVNIIGTLVDSASPFLFPCTIEYSLICAAICYVMWNSMARRRVAACSLKRSLTTESLHIAKGEIRSPHQYTVDCAGSNKGFFCGIILFVITIMSLILNFVFVKHDDYMEQATFVVNITEIVLYCSSILAVLIGMCRFSQLRYVSGKNLELDNILLIVAQSGSFVFNVFCIIGGHLTVLENDRLVLIIPILCLIQLCLQTLFILDASKRVASTPEQRRKKPGREIVTFLLVTNLAMWLVNALEKSRGNSHPYLLHFYGVWAWTIITRISMPLAIFYRFHSTVCMSEIWKKAYKIKGQH